MFRATTIDDAGRVVPVVRCNLLLAPFWCGPLPRHVQRQVRHAVEDDRVKWGFLHAGWWRIAIIVVPPLALFFLPSGLRLVWPAAGASAGMMRSLLIAPLMLATVWMLMPWIANDRQRRVIARAASQAGYCGSCGYSLAGAAENDGRRLCSECGASWNRGPPGDFF